MPVTPSLNLPKEKPPRSDHVVVYGYEGNRYLAIRVDRVTGALTAIQIAHHEVHEGQMYTAGYKTPEGTPLADDASIDLLIRTAAKYCHLVGAVEADGDCEVFWYEGTTITGEAYGAAVAAIAMNRAKIEAATVAVTIGPTVAAVGTVLSSQWLIGGQKNQAFGGVLRQETEYILAPNQAYLLRLTNRRGSAANVGETVQWYEESNL